MANSSASNWAVYRMKGLEANLLDAVMKAADCFLETKTPFDLDFDLDSDDKLYCTELIVECFRSVGKNPFPDKTGKDIIFPSMFCSNQDFFEVYNSKAQRGKKK